MTKYKNDMAERYAANAGITKKAAKQNIEDVFSVIADILIEGDDVQIAKFFHFQARTTAAKSCLNPLTKEPMTIPAKKTVRMKMTRALKKRIQES